MLFCPQSGQHSILGFGFNCVEVLIALCKLVQYRNGYRYIFGLKILKFTGDFREEGAH